MSTRLADKSGPQDGPRRATAGARTAFTLIELLTVLAIISLLVAMLVPAINKARAIARGAMCASNMSGLVKAHGMYGTEQRGMKPVLMRRGMMSLRVDWVSPDTKWSNTPVGQGLLVTGRYVTFDQLLCPALSMQRDAAIDRANWAGSSTAGSSYAYYWRHPDEVTNSSDPSEGASYQRACERGRWALAMDINCQQGHQYVGDFTGREWVSHPGLNVVYVAYIDGPVKTVDSESLVLQCPGGSAEELTWFDQAHRLR
jgi:prepilin-type N-terminal cleavage/methylation domain-containing protein